MTHALAFLGVSAVVIVTPGQDTALTIRNTLAGNRRNGIFTAGGVAAGQATWTLAAAAGVAALLRTSQPAFTAVRIAGACYLVYLGATTLVEAWRGRKPSHAAKRTTARGSFRQGLVSNLGNPKMAIFFTSLLPQFGTSFGAMLLLGTVFCTLTFIWLSAYGVVVARAGDVLRRPRMRRIVGAVTGTALAAFGVRLAVER